jgi:adenylate cyclase
VGADRLFDWLVDGAPGITTPADVVTRIGEELVDEGIPVCRITAFVSTLHPDVYGRMFSWNLGGTILAGRIRKGDIEDIRAVIWFSDLRGFTQLSQRHGAREVIDVLNRAFECQVAAIDKHGGEVLKFMGDGLLAIFALPPDVDVPERCNAALDAAVEAQRAFATVGGDLSFGLALHIGTIAYGNIGGHGRLDFTAIGPAVNLAARLETLTGKLGKPIVLSAELAALTTHEVASIGAFELKGIDGMSTVYAPSARPE